MAGAKLVGGPAWRVLEVGSRGPRVVVCSSPAHTLRGPSHEFVIRYARVFTPRWLAIAAHGFSFVPR